MTSTLRIFMPGAHPRIRSQTRALPPDLLPVEGASMTTLPNANLRSVSTFQRQDRRNTPAFASCARESRCVSP